MINDFGIAIEGYISFESFEQKENVITIDLIELTEKGIQLIEHIQHLDLSIIIRRLEVLPKLIETNNGDTPFVSREKLQNAINMLELGDYITIESI